MYRIHTYTYAYACHMHMYNVHICKAYAVIPICTRSRACFGASTNPRRDATFTQQPARRRASSLLLITYMYVWVYRRKCTIHCTLYKMCISGSSTTHRFYFYGIIPRSPLKYCLYHYLSIIIYSIEYSF